MWWGLIRVGGGCNQRYVGTGIRLHRGLIGTAGSSRLSGRRWVWAGKIPIVAAFGSGLSCGRARSTFWPGMTLIVATTRREQHVILRPRHQWYKSLIIGDGEISQTLSEAPRPRDETEGVSGSSLLGDIRDLLTPFLTAQLQRILCHSRSRAARHNTRSVSEDRRLRTAAFAGVPGPVYSRCTFCSFCRQHAVVRMTWMSIPSSVTCHDLIRNRRRARAYLGI